MQPIPPQSGMTSYGYPYGAPIQQPLPLNQFGINAGIYAGSYGSGNGFIGPQMPYGGGNGLLGPNGPYGSTNNHVGGSYGGLSSWPIISPWQPLPVTLIPPLVISPQINNRTTTTTTIAPRSTVTNRSTNSNVQPSVISMPIENILPDELALPPEITNS